MSTSQAFNWIVLDFHTDEVPGKYAVKLSTPTLTLSVSEGDIDYSTLVSLSSFIDNHEAPCDPRRLASCSSKGMRRGENIAACYGCFLGARRFTAYRMTLLLSRPRLETFSIRDCSWVCRSLPSRPAHLDALFTMLCWQAMKDLLVTTCPKRTTIQVTFSACTMITAALKSSARRSEKEHMLK